MIMVVIIMVIYENVSDYNYDDDNHDGCDNSYDNHDGHDHPS